MYVFKTERVTDKVTRIHGFASEMMYLVEGSEKAILIDTGRGFTSLRACVEKLTNKPVTVVITHGHVDHAMGAAEFRDVYMSVLDHGVYLPHGDFDFRWKEAFEMPGMMRMTDADVAKQFTREDYIPTADPRLFKDLNEGDIFDAGGVSVEIYDLPGHSPGSRAMLIPEERILVTGDACNRVTGISGARITDYKAALEALYLKVKGRYDMVLESHGRVPYGEETGYGNVTMLESAIELCGEIIAGTDDHIERMPQFGLSKIPTYMAKKTGPDMHRLDGGLANIRYREI